MFKHIVLAVVLMIVTSVSSASFVVEQIPEGLEITPSIAFVKADVSLDGPFGLQQLSFVGDQSIVIPVPRLDGQYKYEVVLTPLLTPAQLQLRNAARASLDDMPVIASDLTAFSGNFAVMGNSFVAAITEGGGTNTDAAVPDPRVVIVPSGQDGIIQGSLCVGFDCPATPSFGFDTFRMQENNLRIHFDDTSTTGSFPGNDWRLLANDSGNGGANLFALEDSTAGRRIAVFEAAAPANSLYMDNAGNIGLGTNNPLVELHVVDGDTATVRLDQNGSGGFATQVWDMAGNETNFFIRDATNGSSLPFRIRPGVATDDTLIIDSAGQVVIGDTGSVDASATLHVRSRGNGEPAMLIQNRAATVVDILSLADNGDMILAGTLAQLSRQDSKEHFKQIDHQAMLTALKGLDISTWNYKHQDDSERHLGPMAEAFYASYGLGTDPEHIATSDMAAVALASSQALLFELEAKDQRITELETRLQRLEALMVQVLDQKDDQDIQQIVSH